MRRGIAAEGCVVLRKRQELCGEAAAAADSYQAVGASELSQMFAKALSTGGLAVDSMGNTLLAGHGWWRWRGVKYIGASVSIT